MAAGRHTDEQRREILRVADTFGTGYAVAEFGVSAGTIRKWRTRLGWIPSRERVDRLAEGNAVQYLEWETRRIALAGKLGEIAEQAADRVQAELRDKRPQALPNAVNASVVMARAIDKAQLLTGAATVRTEDVGARERAGELLDRLIAQSQGPTT